MLYFVINVSICNGFAMYYLNRIRILVEPQTLLGLVYTYERLYVILWVGRSSDLDCYHGVGVCILKDVSSVHGLVQSAHARIRDNATSTCKPNYENR